MSYILADEQMIYLESDFYSLIYVNKWDTFSMEYSTVLHFFLSELGHWQKENLSGYCSNHGNKPAFNLPEVLAERLVSRLQPSLYRPIGVHFLSLYCYNLIKMSNGESVC